MSDGDHAQSLPPSASSSEVLNIQALEAACGEDGTHELLSIFLESTQILFQRMETALAHQDSKALKATAHEMKGACGSVGANTMAELSRSMEEFALCCDWVESARLLQSLKENFTLVRAYCQRMLKSD
jgi:HPt (histidine-containing phosphotransfer) domain-containing protein